MAPIRSPAARAWRMFSRICAIMARHVRLRPPSSRFRRTDLDPSPFLDDLCDRGEIRLRPEPRLRDRQHLSDDGANDHRHAHLLRFIDAKTYILVREPRR